MRTTRSRFLPFLMWLLPLSFFTYQFILRLWPSLMMQQIMQQFSIDATGFGFLASLYYYGYAGMQIPIAILLDKYGPRYVVSVCAFSCGVAMLTFCHTHNWYLALLSRFLIGVSSAAGFLGTSKVISQWFSKDEYAKMVGYSFTVGLLGAIYGGKPLNLLLEKFGWQTVAYVLASVSMFIGVLSYFILCVPTYSLVQSKRESFCFNDFIKLLRSPFIWFLGVANLLMVGSLEGFADVWGVSYLMEVYEFTKSEAAGLTSFIFVGMLFGGPLLAAISKKFGQFSVISLCGFGMASGLLYLITSSANINYYMLTALFFVIGILCCYQVIIFAVAHDMVSVKMLGIVVAFLNCTNMLGGSFFHSTIGMVMDMNWTGKYDTNIMRQYTVESYSHAMLVVPVCALLGAMIVLGLRLSKWYNQKRVSEEV